MDFLIIGGTKFLGRALAEEITNQGHTLTLFHRGQTSPDFMPNADRILGDRETDLKNLGERTWDVVIDTCGYFPRLVQLSAEHLKNRVKNYIFISTISIYKETNLIGIDETFEQAVIEDETVEEVTGESYGPLKYLCEEVVREVYGQQATIIRPGLIVGPYDPTNRFTYWLTRIREGGEILAPGDGTFPLQFIDVRDLAKFILQLAVDQIYGTYNVTGPQSPVALTKLFDEIQRITNSACQFHWARDDWLVNHEVSPWMEMPLWIPTDEGRALMQVSIKKAVEKGLNFRPLAQTILATLDWFDEISGKSQEWPAGLDPHKERQLLDKLEQS